MVNGLKIRDITEADIACVRTIYNHYVASTVITFEEGVVDLEEMSARVDAIKRFSLPWLVAEQDGEIQGYAHASQWRARSAYRFAVESTIYLDPKCSGAGIGSKLYEVLLGKLERKGVRTVIGVIGLPNNVSEALHEKFGFEKSAHLSKVGYKFERWLDVAYWQKSFF